METGSCLISQWFWAAQRMVELVSCGLRCLRWAKGLLQPRFEEDERRAMKFPWYLKDLRCMWLVLPFFCSFGTGFPCPQHWRSASDGLGRGFTRRVELLGQVRGPVWAQSRHFPSSTSTRACSTSLSSFEFVVRARCRGAPAPIRYDSEPEKRGARLMISSPRQLKPDSRGDFARPVSF